MKRLILGLLAASCIAIELNSGQCPLLTPSHTLSSDQSLSELLHKSLDMTWSFGDTGYFRISTKHHEAYFELVFFKTLPDSFADIKDLFIEDTQSFRYSYRLRTGDWTQVNIFDNAPFNDPNSSNYVIADRRILQEAHPQTLSIAELEEIIRSKSVLFYTGAGLSAPFVPTMTQLNGLLGFIESDRFLDSLKQAISDPKKLASSIQNFHNACFFSPPTGAHYALTKLAQQKQAAIVTENLDYLHEYTGIIPYRIDAKEFRATVNPLALQEIDYVICIGLSFDDRGFLGFYKENNPHGKIIAVDLAKPSYLGDEDFIVQGDLQEIISGLVL